MGDSCTAQRYILHDLWCAKLLGSCYTAYYDTDRMGSARTPNITAGYLANVQHVHAHIKNAALKPAQNYPLYAAVAHSVAAYVMLMHAVVRCSR